jgi:hypothetical protein
LLAPLATVGCSPPATNSGESAEASAAAEAPAGAAVTREALTGYWDHNPRCGANEGTWLRADGTYRMTDGFGTWSLSGDILTVVQKRAPSAQIFQARLGDPGESRVTIIQANTLSVTWLGGGSSRFYRCRPR